ncbi:hypothetical protein [Prevotella sp. MA2016]|uniref:hypothetical protein n=1 Tax=Prevotella sp. MA2016 TaxID=1408310 RepID=UPI00048FBAF3|nr:hypothetical protein [Prevotella sp. MA2016]
MRENYNEYDKFSGLYREKRKPSILVIVLIGLLLLLVCSLGYDNLIKPYLANRKQQTETQVEPTPSEKEYVTASEPDIIISDEKEVVTEKLNEKPVQSKERDASEQTVIYPEPTPKQTKVDQRTEPTESERPVQPEHPRNEIRSSASKANDYNNLSTSEVLEKQTHARVVKQAKQAGVSTEGSTSEILERITHARVVKQAQQAGVSTEGSTSDILERITHARVVKQARQAGVSAEGSTSEILERITHARVVKQAKQAGVSTEGSTSDILERMTRKRLEERGY